MKRKSSYYKLFAEKPDTFSGMPESIMSLEQLEALRKIPRIALGEICGSESITAVHTALDRSTMDAFLPTIVYTGAEHGHWQTVLEKLSSFKKLVEKSLRIYCLEPIILGAPAFWWALNGRLMAEMNKRFNFYTPCLGCRLYSLAVRVPLCKKIGCAMILSGITPVSAGSYVVNASEDVMYYCKTMLSSFGINLIKGTQTTQSTEQKTDSTAADIADVCSLCILKDNYKMPNKLYREQPDTQKYFEQFAIPAAAKIISRVLSGRKTDYLKEVMDTIVPAENKKTKKSD